MRGRLHRRAAGMGIAVLLAAGLPGIGSAQAPNPQWLRFTVATIKPDMTAEYEGYQKQMAAAYKKAGQSGYMVFQNFAGPRNEYTAVTFVTKFADLDGPNPIAKAVGEEAYQNLISHLTRCTVSSNRYFARPWDDVAIDKPGPMGQYILRSRIPIASGKAEEYRAYIKNELKPIYEKAGVTWFHASQPSFGGPVGMVETVRMLKNLAEIDGGPIVTRVLGAAGAATVNKKADGLTRGETQRTILRMRPDLSLMPPPAK